MTPEQRRNKFREWLEATYGAKQPRQEFVQDFNAVAQAAGAKPITWAKANHWMYDRQPPSHVGTLTFEQSLERIAARRRRIVERANELMVAPEEALQRAQEEEDAASATRTYTITLPVDRETEQAITRYAGTSGMTEEDWLRSTLEEMLDNRRQEEERNEPKGDCGRIAGRL